MIESTTTKVTRELKTNSVEIDKIERITSFKTLMISKKIVTKNVMIFLF